MASAATRKNLKGIPHGFTLVEMSVVLIIVGLLILTIFPALTAMRTSSQRAATQSNLQALMLATAAFVQANGCLPCPTPAGTLGGGFGRVGGSTGTAACVACGGVGDGIVPFISLGVSQNVARDGWGRWISMRVDPALTTAFNIVPPTKPVACACAAPVNGVCAASPAGCSCSAPVNTLCTPLPAGISQQGLCASGLATANRIGITTPGGSTQPAAVLFISYGSKGYGAFRADALGFLAGYNNGSRYPFPSGSPSCPSNLINVLSTQNTGLTVSVCNANDNGQFVNTTNMDGYDDMMTFADRNTLISMFGNGACQTVW